MPGAYSTFDTLSIELSDMTSAGQAEPLEPLPVLARIAEVNAAPANPVARIQSAHAAATGPKQSNPAPTTTSFEVRTDTPAPLAETIAAPAEPVAAPQVAPPPEPISPQPTTHTRIDAAEVVNEPIGEADEPSRAAWIESLLRVEAAIAPYSQVIVLITLLAAASLTLILLRGGGGRLESGSPATSPAEGASLAKTPPPITNMTPELAPPLLADIAAIEPPKASARGPIGIKPPAEPSAARVAIAPVQPHREPHREPTEVLVEPAARVAQAPLPYPTTDAPAPAEVGAEPIGAQRKPLARLSGRVLPYQQQTTK